MAIKREKPVFTAFRNPDLMTRFEIEIQLISPLDLPFPATEKGTSAPFATDTQVMRRPKWFCGDVLPLHRKTRILTPLLSNIFACASAVHFFRLRR